MPRPKVARYAVPWPGSSVQRGFAALLLLIITVALALWALTARIEPGVVLFGAGVFFFAALSSVSKKPRIVRVAGNELHGLGAPLPIGAGDVVIERIHWTTYYDGIIHHVRFDVRYGGRELLSTPDALAARSFGEALARIARVPVHWTHPEVADDLNTLKLLPVDAPLVDRMREVSSEAVTLSEPGDALVHVELHGNALSLEAPIKPWRALAALCAAAAGHAWLASGEFETEIGRKWLIMLIAFAWTVFACSLPRALVARRLRVDGDGITLGRRLLGLIPIGARRFAANDIDGLHIDEGELLVTGGNGAFARFVVGKSRKAADWARAIVASSLAGDRKAAAAPALDTPQVEPPSAHTIHACPRCLAKLGDAGGALDDATCAKCRGRFLSPAGAERLLEGELGISKEILRGILQSFAGKRLTCPGCSSQTSPARLRGVACDLCTGCGGLWLDDGELGALTQGRHRG